MRAPLILAVGITLLAGAGCGGRRATADDCREILDRLVDLELQERGFRDPVVTGRSRAEAESAHAADLAACQGRRMPRAAMACVRAATSSEEMSHRCFK
jgi:hypothetical protein